MGCFEMPNYAEGTLEVGRALANLTDAITIIGGGAVSYTHLTLPTTSRRCRSRWSPYH